MTRRRLLGVVLAAGLAATTAAAAPPSSAPRDLDLARAAQVEAARRYRASLETLIEVRQAALARAEEMLARRRALAARDLIARADVEAAERAVAEARAEVERARASIQEAETVVAEVEAAREVAALPPTASGQVRAGATLIRHDGRTPWSLAQLAALERFFVERFHRPLPVSARGQTRVHDRLGFDHHDALDVAVHPDSAEGRATMEYLRGRGIPFLAFRAAQPGVATGAHLHVGRPSPPAS
jgi:hypothetical protein